MDIEIRLAIPSDASQLAKLRYEFRASRGAPPEPAQVFLDRCQAWMAARLDRDPSWRCWVALDGEMAIGNVWVEFIAKVPNPLPERERHAYITNFYMQEHTRGTGIGSRLLAAAIRECKMHDVHAVILWPSQLSRPLYIRHGFADCGPIMHLDLQELAPLTTVNQYAATSDRTRAVVTQFYDVVWNTRNTEHMYVIAHEDFTFRGSLGPELSGIAAFIGYVTLVTTALSDYRCDVEELTVQENRAFAKVLFSGLHEGELLGYAPTNRRLSWYGAASFTLSEGKIVDLWILGDVDGLRRQIEAPS